MNDTSGGLKCNGRGSGNMFSYISNSRKDILESSELYRKKTVSAFVGRALWMLGCCGRKV